MNGRRMMGLVLCGNSGCIWIVSEDIWMYFENQFTCKKNGFGIGIETWFGLNLEIVLKIGLN